MGIEKAAVTFRLEQRHLQLLAAARACPPVENNSHALRALLDGLVALMVTGRMPEWMAALQGVLQKPLCTQDSVVGLGDPLSSRVDHGRDVSHACNPTAEAIPLPSPETEDGRASEIKTEGLKRPPRKIVYQGNLYRICIPGQHPIHAKKFLAQVVPCGARTKVGAA